jgi:SAM-dependent methyltransferase
MVLPVLVWGHNVLVVADAHYEDPRLARIYDPLDPDRSDLDAYLALVDELGVRSVLDVGCGTGSFACVARKVSALIDGVSSPSLDGRDVGILAPALQIPDVVQKTSRIGEIARCPSVDRLLFEVAGAAETNGVEH